MSFEKTIALLVFLLPLAYSPGPGNMFFAATGARFGFSATILPNLGYHLATIIVTLLIGFGFGIALQEQPKVMLVVQYAGALYILYLAYCFLRTGIYKGQEKSKTTSFF